MGKRPWNTAAQRGYAAKALAQRGMARTIHSRNGNVSCREDAMPAGGLAGVFVRFSACGSSFSGHLRCAPELQCDRGENWSDRCGHTKPRWTPNGPQLAVIGHGGRELWRTLASEFEDEDRAVHCSRAAPSARDGVAVPPVAPL
jgi:hypothetical protein